MSPQRLLFTALTVSLLVNAFFVGFAATRWLDRPSEQARGGIVHAVGKRLTRDLDDDSRAQVAAALDTLEPEYQASLEKRRADYRQLRTLLAAPEVDREALDLVMRDMEGRSSELVYQVHETAVDAILELPAGQRAALSADDSSE